MVTEDTPTEVNVRKIARIEDKATSTFLEVIEFTKSDAECGRIELAPSVVNNLGSFANALRDSGAILPKDDNDLKLLLKEVAKSDPAEDWVYEAHVGWTSSGLAYVTADGVIGEVPKTVIGVNRSKTLIDPSGHLSISGTWTGWRDSVGKLARLSSVMMLTICIALAGPLLYVLRRRSFTVCLFGKTKTGKTIATLMGASVIGIGEIKQLLTWRIKDARLEQRLPEYNDGMFPIDDLETMEEKEEKKKYLRIRNIAYNLEQGSSMGRHDSYTKAHGGVHEHWRCITVTSNEKSIRDLAISAGQHRQHGETLRLIDVPAMLDGLDHIFDVLPPNFETDDFQKWKRDTFKTIVDGCKQHHGEAIRKHILALIARSNLERYVLGGIDYFVKRVCDDKDGDIARDVAEKFGLIYVGGMLGIRSGLLPWNEAELLNAVSKCYIGARELLPDDGVLLRQGIKALGQKLIGLPSLSDVRSKDSTMAQIGKLDGYRVRKKTAYRCLIKREVFNAIFASKLQRDLVVDWLIKKNRITTAVAKTSEPGANRRPKEQFPWADGQRRRSLEIRWPQPRKVLEAGKAASKQESKQ